MLPLVLMLATLPDAPPPACAGYTLHRSREALAADAAMIGAASGKRTLPRAIDAELGDGHWQIIWATPHDSEGGVFFFKRQGSKPAFVDVWGGMTTDRRSAARWAVKLGVPNALAQCFATRLVEKGP
jgi:hypothetical protein